MKNSVNKFRRRTLSVFVTAVLVSGLSNAATLTNQNTLQLHRDHIKELSAQLGADHSFALSRAEVDELGMTHAHFQQYFKGVRVFGGELITHADKASNFRDSTESIFQNINIGVTPSITSTQALTIANKFLSPKAAYKIPPKIELVVYPILSLTKIRDGEDATAYEYRSKEYRLAYIVSSKVESPAETSHSVQVIDANSGTVLNQWDDLHNADATGTGHSEYSGTVQIKSNSLTSGFELRDVTRGTTAGTFGAGNVVTNLNKGTSGNGTVYTDTDNAWGDGLNYNPSNTTTSDNGETAAVDAAYGLQVTWDMYKKVFGRNGIDGAGKATYLRTHYSTLYDNAFWDDTCFCMTFGDGQTFKVLTSLDVVGHELTHGVTANNGHGGLVYSGESGGLNESSSDIMGTMTEFYSNGGGYTANATTIPSSGGNWLIGEQLSSTPLRYMYRPSKDGISPDAWSSSIGSMNVHYSSGPGNRAFYFLSQGSSSSSSSDFYSSYLPGGMLGVGNDHAAHIHYRALTTYYTSSETYAQARVAYINAATDLYGASSSDVRAVQNAFAAINVGTAAPPVQNPRWIPAVTSLLLN